MAIAKKCDICGKLYEIYNKGNNSNKPNGFMFLSIDEIGHYYSYKKTDCCPYCIESVTSYIKRLGGGNNEQ